MSKISELSDGGSLVSTDFLIAVRSGGNVKVQMDTINVDQVDLGDNEFIRLGNSQDLTLVHTSTQSIINQAGVGDLLIQKAGATKLTINASGIDVAGTVTADGLTVENSLSGATNLFNFQNTSNTANSNSRLKISTGGTSGGDPILQLTDNASNWYVFGDQSDSFKFKIGTSVTDNKFVMDSTGAATFAGSVTADGAVNSTYFIGGSSSVAGRQLTLSCEANGGQNNATHRLTVPSGYGSFNINVGGSERMVIDSNGDLSLYEDTGTTPKFFWDASAESLGIGNAIPIAALDVTGTDAVGSLTSLADTVTRAAAIIRGSTHANGYGLYMGYGDASTDAQYIQSTIKNGAQAYPLLINPYGGDVGIGTASPQKSLHVNSGTGNIGVRVESSDATASIEFMDSGTTSTSTSARIGGISDDFFVQTNGAERLRIDASGNILVGTTSAAGSSAPDNSATASDAGIRQSPTGFIGLGTSNASSLYLNRIGNDGDIVRLLKDGTTVGSIGVVSNRLYAGTGDTGLFFSNTTNGIHPWDTTSNSARDAGIDLGSATRRFKDLYLSGASLAGAGSAASPSISFSGDTNTGLYSGGADNISFATGGTARAFMSATQFNMTGNGVFSGSISKGSGSFKIDHPLPEKTETHHLVHSFVESPQADNIYRGKVDLVDGSATVNIDDAAGMTEGTYVLLNTNTQCFTSNESGWTAVKGSVSGNILTITAQESCSDTISWMVVGERHDQHMLDTEWTDENGKVIVEPLKES